MSLFDLLFPQIATAFHLRALRNQSQQPSSLEHANALRDSRTTEALKLRIDELENDLGLVVLVLSSLLSALDERGTISRADIEREIKELDGVDGKLDERVSTRILKAYLSNKNR